MPLDPAIVYGPTLTPTTGWVRVGNIAGFPALITGWDVSVERGPVMQEPPACPPLGYKQKVLHAAGTAEVRYQVRGEMSLESRGLLQFLDPANRGAIFSVAVAQVGIVDFLSRCVFREFTLNGGPDAVVSFSLSGHSLDFPTQGVVNEGPGYHHPLPTWATGNSLMTEWTLQHTIPQEPRWHNNQNPLPAYYRPGASEFRLSYHTAVQLVNHDFLSLGIGSFLISGIVQRQGIVSQNRDVRFYPVEVMNVSFDNFPLEAGGLVTIATGVPFAGYPDGV
jgi:hypothetical protein